PARADIVAVRGTASFDSLPLYDPVLLAKIGYLADPQGTFEFSYSYSTTSQLSTGTWKLVPRDPNRVVIAADTIDLNPVTVSYLAIDDATYGQTYDDYVAQIQSTRSGTDFLVGFELVDDNKAVFPALQTQPGVYLNNLGLWTRWILAIGVPDAACNGQF